jgi:hypothetical protein
VFSVLTVPRCYKQDKLMKGQLMDWSELISEIVSWRTSAVQLLRATAVRRWWLRPETVREPRGKGTSAVGSRYQAKASEDYNKTEKT